VILFSGISSIAENRAQIGLLPVKMEASAEETADARWIISLSSKAS
jgi:hypothetical protein